MKKRLAAHLRRLGPWLVALATLAWLFHKVPAGELMATMSRVPIATFAALVVALVVATLLTDSFAISATFRSALPEAHLTFLEALVIRGATYLLAIIHYGAGQGGVAYFVSRRPGVALARAAGAVILIMGVNVIVVALVALLGVILGGAPGRPAIRWIVLALSCAFPVYLAVIAARPAFLLRSRLLAPLFRAGLGGHAVAVAARLPHLGALVVGQYFVLRLFGIVVPFEKALALLPIVFVVSTLPISPSGIGTSQATMVALFWMWAPGDTREAKEATVLACGLALQLFGLVIQALVGLVFLRRVAVSSSSGGKDGGTGPPPTAGRSEAT